MSFVIQCHGYANGFRCEFDGQFLKSYEPNGDSVLGLGEWTNNVKEAIKYKTFNFAFETWKAERTVNPIKRIDGKPDRPLTAFNIEIKEYKDV